MNTLGEARCLKLVSGFCGEKISELLPFSWSGAQPLGDTEPMWGRTGGEKLEGRERISNANKTQKAVLEIM